MANDKKKKEKKDPVLAIVPKYTRGDGTALDNVNVSSCLITITTTTVERNLKLEGPVANDLLPVLFFSTDPTLHQQHINNQPTNRHSYTPGSGISTPLLWIDTYKTENPK